MHEKHIDQLSSFPRDHNAEQDWKKQQQQKK